MRKISILFTILPFVSFAEGKFYTSASVGASEVKSKISRNNSINKKQFVPYGPEEEKKSTGEGLDDDTEYKEEAKDLNNLEQETGGNMTEKNKEALITPTEANGEGEEKLAGGLPETSNAGKAGVVEGVSDFVDPNKGGEDGTELSGTEGAEGAEKQKIGFQVEGYDQNNPNNLDGSEQQKIENTMSNLDESEQQKIENTIKTEVNDKSNTDKGSITKITANNASEDDNNNTRSEVNLNKVKSSTSTISPTISIAIGYSFDVNNFAFATELGLDLGKIELGSHAKNELEVKNNFHLYLVQKLGYKFRNKIPYVVFGLGVKDVKIENEKHDINNFIVGAGYEHRFTKNISAFTEFNFHIPTQSKNVGDLDVKILASQFKVGVRYYF